MIKQKSVEWLRDLGNLEVNVTDVRTIKCLVLLPDSFFFFFFLTIGRQQAVHVQTSQVEQRSCTFVQVLRLVLDTLVMKAGFG